MAAALAAARPTRPGDNWEISISSPTSMETLDPGEMRENMKLSPRPPPEHGSTENINSDECWLINIKAPATLSVTRADADDEGNQVRHKLSNKVNHLTN